MYFVLGQTTDTTKTETIGEKLSLNLSEPVEITKQFSTDINMHAHLDLNVLNNFGSDTESVNSLKFIEAPVDMENELNLNSDNQSLDKVTTDTMNDDDDFTTFQSSKPDMDNFGMNSISFKLPLRETHISTQNEVFTEPYKHPVVNIESLELKSTIVTPELSRKSIEIQEDDDFADFQMSLPQTEKPKTDFISTVPMELLKPIVLESSLSNMPTQINWPEPGIVSDDINEFEFNFTPIITSKETEKMNNESEINTSDIRTLDKDNKDARKISFESNLSSSDTVLNFTTGINNKEKMNSVSNMSMPNAPVNYTSNFVQKETKMSLDQEITVAKLTETNETVGFSNLSEPISFTSSNFNEKVIESRYNSKSKMTENKNKNKVISTPEEDDWSDFVCAEEPSKNKKLDSPKTVTSHNSIFPVPAKIQKSPKLQNYYQNTNSFSMFQNVSQPPSQLELSVPNLQNTQLTQHTVLPPSFIPNTTPTKTNTYNQQSTQQIAAQQVGYGYQPPYQIPVQTINTPFGGLPQTSLSTYNHFTVGPIELGTQTSGREGKSLNSSEFGLFNGPFTSEIKPLQTYAPPAKMSSESQFPNQTGYHLQSVESTFLKMQQPTQTSKQFLNMTSTVSSSQDDDDDWSDFVSSQPAVPAATTALNGLSNSQHKVASVGKPFPNNFNKPPILSSWSSDMTPNIITNPVHFEVFQTYQPGSSQDNKTVNSKKSGNTHHTHVKNKSSVPSISALPDLDFIAPKNKFFSKK